MIRSFFSWSNSLLFIVLSIQTCGFYSFTLPKISVSNSFSRRFAKNDEKFDLKTDQPITVQDAYHKGMEWLTSKCVTFPEWSSRHFLCHLKEIGDHKQVAFKESFDKILSVESISRFCQMINERKTFRPVQYIIGSWEFYNRKFICREPVHFPRPTTEDFAELLLKDLCKYQKKLNILEVGPGTGVLGVTLCDRLPNINQMVCIDIGEEAVQLTKENAYNILSEEKKVNNFHCYHTDFISFLSKFPDLHNSFDVIVSNPPYIPSWEIPQFIIDIRGGFEDVRSLDGGEDGLDIARQIVLNAPKLLKPRGLKMVWLELDSDQPFPLKEELQSFPEIETIEPLQDTLGSHRFAKIRYR
jgi:release factor glutamine methyltransferase